LRFCRLWYVLESRAITYDPCKYNDDGHWFGVTVTAKTVAGSTSTDIRVAVDFWHFLRSEGGGALHRPGGATA
jgi:hypothetical protein